MAGWAKVHRWLVLGAAVLGIAVVLPEVVVTPQPAAAEVTSGDLLIDEVGGHVFAAHNDVVEVFDLDGALVDTVTGQTGVRDIVLHGRDLYVLATGANRINRVDADTFDVLGGWSISTTPYAAAIAWSNGKLWYTYGNQWSGGLASLSPATGTIATPSTGLYAGGDIVATESPARVYVLDRGLSPSKIHSFDITTDPPTALATSPHSNACGNGRRLAMLPDGSKAWTACGAPYQFNQWNPATLAEPATSYPATPYPNAIAVSPDGAYLIGGTQSWYDKDVWLYAVGNTSAVRSWEIGSTDVGLVEGMVAVSSGGARAYAMTESGVLKVWDQRPSITSVSRHVLEGTPASVDLVGSQLSDVTSVSIDGTPATFTVASDSLIHLSVPSLAAGDHVVRATSPWGKGDATLVAAAVAPDAPSAPSITGTGVRSVSLSWSAPPAHGHPITSYTVRAYLDGSSSVAATATVATTSATVTGLISEEAYRFKVAATSVGGTGAFSPASDLAIAGDPDLGPFASIGDLVDQLGKDTFGRPLTSGERSTAVGQLATGATTPADLLGQWRRSGDATGSVDPVARIYRATFLRNPDRSGFDYWVAKKRKGARLAAIGDTFARSSEFVRRYGTLSNRAYVERLYQNVLGRTGDPAGIAYWQAKLDTKAKTRGDVLVGMSESNEYKRKQAATVDVAVLYLQLLRRQPTSAELSAGTSSLDGGGSVGDLAWTLVDSPEYASRLG
ncbi:MAG: DUF4214 domain-containing protein [Acidimicrobiales bacterium]